LPSPGRFGNASTPKNPLWKTQKRCGLPSKVLRLETGAIVRFQQLTMNFNRTMLRLRISPSESKSKEATNAPAAKSSAQSAEKPTAEKQARNGLKPR
jgi:hypothetical protein